MGNLDLGNEPCSVVVNMRSLNKDGASIALVCVSYMCGLVVWHGIECAMLTTAACLFTTSAYFCISWFTRSIPNYFRATRKPELQLSNTVSPTKPSTATRTREVLRGMVEPETDSEYKSSDDEWMVHRHVHSHPPVSERVLLEADEIIDEIRREAHLRCSDEIIREAKRDAEGLKEAAKSEAEAMVQQARQELEERQRLMDEVGLNHLTQLHAESGLGILQMEPNGLPADQVTENHKNIESAISRCVHEHFTLLQPEIDFSTLCGNLTCSERHHESNNSRRKWTSSVPRVAAGPRGQGFGSRSKRKQPKIIVTRRTPNAY